MSADRADVPVSPAHAAGRSGGPVVDAAGVVAILRRLRQRVPRIHVLTAPVAQPFTAAMLLAIGAGPSMTTVPEEVPAFVAAADGVLVNLGVVDRIRRDAALTAIEVAKEAGLPWLLDPVRIEVEPARMAFARRLMDLEPAIVHANHAEFAALAGVPAEDEPVRAFAVRSISTLVVTGEVDIVTDGRRVVRVGNGHPLMERVAAIGCAGIALMTAFRAVEPDPVSAAVAALVVLGVAGEVAAAAAGGPGSFTAEILDALYGLEDETLLERADIR